MSHVFDATRNFILLLISYFCNNLLL